MTPHDKAIEAAAKAEFTHVWRGEDWEKAEPKRRAAYIEPAKRYVAAYLAALEAEGGARKGHAFVDSNSGWASGEYPPSPDEFPVLIIKTEYPLAAQPEIK
jgi:hypothetical protein